MKISFLERTQLLFAIIFYLNINAQIKEKYSAEVEEYMNALTEYKDKYNYAPAPADFSISNQELNNLMLKMYNAIASNPEGYTNYLGRNILNQREQIKSGAMDKNKTSIGDIHKLIRSKLENQYSQKFITLITTPYFLKVKIIGKTSGTYTTDIGHEYEQYLVKAEIEEILKGELKYKIGDQITFMYLKFRTCDRKYEVGKTYFIPLEVVTTVSSNFNGLTPQWFDCHGNYEIYNNNISIPDNYFEFGNSLSWNEFKNYFKDNYVDYFIQINHNIKLRR